MNRNKEIQKELEMIAPHLAKMEFKSAFKVPKGYFDELQDTVLESVSPLAELKKDRAFTVPKNYFESLPDLVLERARPQHATEVISEPEAVRGNQPNWIDDLINQVAVFFQPRYALKLAAVAIVLAGGIFFMLNQNSSNTTLAAADSDLLEEYGLNVDDLNDDDLALLLSDASIDAEPEVATDDVLLDELLNNLDDLSDEDLEGLF